MDEIKLRKLKKQGSSNKKLKYPDMIALKVVVKLDPIQIGLYYKRFESDQKKKLYIVELQSLLQLSDPFEITSALYAQHETHFNNSKVPFNQIYNIIEKMLEFIENELTEEVQVSISEDYKHEPAQKSKNLTYIEESWNGKLNSVDSSKGKGGQKSTSTKQHRY